MSIKVNDFDVKSAEKELKNCPKIVQDYVDCLINVITVDARIITKAKEKIFELSKNLNDSKRERSEPNEA